MAALGTRHWPQRTPAVPQPPENILIVPAAIQSTVSSETARSVWTRLKCEVSLPPGQVRELAAAEGVVLGGENALPCFSPNGVDATALERIVYNTQVG